MIPSSKFLLAAMGAVALNGAAAASVIFDTIPNPLPGNVVSLGYQATSTSQFGDRIQFAGTDRQLTTVTVTMSDWANFSDYPLMSLAGWTHPLTMTLYNVGAGNVVGSAIHSTTVVANIPWHDINGGFNGTAFNVAFSFAGVIVPDEIIFGLAYNTQSYGAAPIGVGGPFNSLNFGLSTVLPSVGTDYNANTLYWDSTYPGPSGPVTPGVFSEDIGWSPYRPAVRFEAEPVPEPASILLVMALLGLAGGAWNFRRHSVI